MYLIPLRASQVVLVVKNPPANAKDVRDAGSIPGSGRFPRGGHGNPFHYVCLENHTDRGAGCATAHGVAKELDMTWRLNRLQQKGAASVMSILQPGN